jgi:hypothetical protein
METNRGNATRNCPSRSKKMGMQGSGENCLRLAAMRRKRGIFLETSPRRMGEWCKMKLPHFYDWRQTGCKLWSGAMLLLDRLFVDARPVILVAELSRFSFEGWNEVSFICVWICRFWQGDGYRHPALPHFGRLDPSNPLPVPNQVLGRTPVTEGAGYSIVMLSPCLCCRSIYIINGQRSKWRGRK